MAHHDRVYDVQKLKTEVNLHRWVNVIGLEYLVASKMRQECVLRDDNTDFFGRDESALFLHI